ncbi:MAG: diguanylate cyclase [Acidimicrobiales bacterium]
MTRFAEDPLAILDGFSDPIVVLDERLMVTGANRAAANLLGVDDTADLLGQQVNDWVHEPDRIDANERLVSLLAGRMVAPVSVRAVRVDGSLVWVEATGAVIRTDAGALRYLIGLRNIDWRHQTDLDAARVIRRSHVLLNAAIELQAATAATFDEVLAEAVADIGPAVGATVVAVHEVDPEGSALCLRGRWTTPRLPGDDEVGSDSVAIETVPNWVTALNSERGMVDVRPERVGVHAEVVGFEPSFRVGVSLPLRPGERLLGALTVGWGPDERVPSEVRDFLEQVGRALGVAMHQVRAQQALIESEALFRDLFENSSAVMYLVDPVSLKLVDANEAAARFYGYERSDLATMDLHLLTIHTAEELAATIEKVRAGGTTVIDEKQVTADGRVRSVEIHSTPMKIGARVVDLAIVQDVTEQREAVSRLQWLASTDDLTGLHNRRRFLQLMADEIERSDRYGRRMSLLMLDLDHFKSVNDTLGHLAGDAALVAFAEGCATHLRANDRMARMGGEEFAILLPETGRDEAGAIAERLRRSTAALSIPELGDRRLRVSIGGAEREAGWTVDALFARADRLLYEAKQAGRDRVVVR